MPLQQDISYRDKDETYSLYNFRYPLTSPLPIIDKIDELIKLISTLWEVSKDVAFIVSDHYISVHYNNGKRYEYLGDYYFMDPSRIKSEVRLIVIN
jgi:hypothetical protein